MLLFDLIDALEREERGDTGPASPAGTMPPTSLPFPPTGATLMPMPPTTAPWPPGMQPPFGHAPTPWRGLPTPRRRPPTLIDLLYRDEPPMMPRAGTFPSPAIPLATAVADERPGLAGAGEPTADGTEALAPTVSTPMTEDEPIEREEPPQLAQAPKQRPKSDLPYPPRPRPQPPASMAKTIRRGVVEIPQDDGSFEIRQGGTRSWRNNNPGNIAYDKIAIANGAVGRDEYGTAIFPSEEIGRRAAFATLQSPTYQAFTLDQAIARWAPKHENDTARYQRFVQSQTGLSGDTRLNTLTQPQLELVYEAIRKFEGWRAGPPPSRVRR